MSARPRLGWQLLAISESSQGVYMYKKAGFNSRPCILHHQQSDIAAIRLTTQQKDPTFTILHHSFRMRFAVATAVSLTVLSSVSALFPLPSGLGQSGCALNTTKSWWINGLANPFWTPSFRPHIESTSLRRSLEILDVDCIPQISDFVFT
ncbi:hypothetical protein MJO28_014301 [Puccinia striiformis f. sp. tritici]|uniref:Uncharacterized protein n=1 Tax=Puccinia striiformis f. sp. tritici TaxID=168172 RepID=A0ACC0DTB0_9BASI|nr:hypothetical protein MJO28_014301 [Puccinia striiformis f. sp. tritici]